MVYFVGAGTGAVDLITVRGMRLLEQADVIIYAGSLVNPELLNYAKEKCKDCFARFYCSGGCAANAFNFTGDINGAYDIGCELQKKRIECAIMLKVEEAVAADA